MERYFASCEGTKFNYRTRMALGFPSLPLKGITNAKSLHRVSPGSFHGPAAQGSVSLSCLPLKSITQLLLIQASRLFSTLVFSLPATMR